MAAGCCPPNTAPLPPVLPEPTQEHVVFPSQGASLPDTAQQMEAPWKPRESGVRGPSQPHPSGTSRREGQSEVGTTKPGKIVLLLLAAELQGCARPLSSNRPVSRMTDGGGAREPEEPSIGGGQERPLSRGGCTGPMWACVPPVPNSRPPPGAWNPHRHAGIGTGSAPQHGVTSGHKPALFKLPLSPWECILSPLRTLEVQSPGVAGGAPPGSRAGPSWGSPTAPGPVAASLRCGRLWARVSGLPRRPPRRTGGSGWAPPGGPRGAAPRKSFRLVASSATEGRT